MGSMLRHLYSVLFCLALPLVVIRLWWRSRREPGYRHHIGERFGTIRPPAKIRQRVWIHAVSAGETIAAVPLARRLLDLEMDVVITNMTPAGRDRVMTLLAGEVAQGRVFPAFVPYDVPLLIDRFIDAADPDLLVLIDTEFWPNLIHCTDQHGIGIVLANGRLSASSFTGYQRFPSVVTPMLDAVDTFLVQSRSHAERLEQLGVPSSRVITCGSIKFDNLLPADTDKKVADMASRIGERRVLLGASTHEGEEIALVQTFLAPAFSASDWLLILALRHVRRRDDIQALLKQENVSFQYYSEGDAVAPSTNVLVIDVMGELLSAYGVADIAFVGGSLVPVGGHNMIEAALSNVPIVMGPHIENVEDIARDFTDAGAMLMVNNAEELVTACSSLVDDQALCQSLVKQAEAIVVQNQGALDTVVDTIATRMK